MQKKIITLLILIVFIQCRLFPQDRGGKLIYGEERLPKSFDPYSYNDDEVNVRMCTLLYQSLFGYQKMSNKLVGILASSFQRINNNEVQIELMRNIKWSDGGEFKSDDVISTIKAINKSSSSWKNYISVFSSVVKIDEYTIRFVLSRPMIEENVKRALTFKILPSYKLIDLPITSSSDIAKKSYGTGYFKYSSRRNQEIELKANNYYRDRDNLKRPYLDYIAINAHSDKSNLIDQLKNGGIDIVVDVPPYRLADIEAARFDIKQYESFSFNYIAINFRNPILSDYLKVRQAIYYGFDRKSIVDNVYNSKATLINSPYILDAVYTPTDLDRYDYDVKKANILLDESGFNMKDANGFRYNASGQKLEFKLLYKIVENDEYRDRIITSFKSDMDKLGIRIIERAENLDSYLRVLKYDFDYDLAFGELLFSNGLNFSQLFHSKFIGLGNYNFIAYKEPRIDREFDKLDNNLTIEEYQNTNKKISRILNTQVPYIFCWSVQKYAAASKEIPNFKSTITPFGFFDYAHELYKRESN